MSDRSTMSRVLLIVCVCVLSLVACSALAWWQWDRFTSVGGSYQNLGYVLQWPLFGLFPAFMFWRMRTLRARARAEEGRTEATDATRESPARTAVPAPRRAAARVPARTARDPEDAALAEYNAYLAELNAREHEENRHGDDRA
ncbi:glucitol operon activator-like protein [Saccharomonospora piscinae]|uniref:glucitol operon activator-like protein n=1 Tax=Saccharomonospora piscinae TaxID=687388 RepID=UPI000467CDFB|nr:glucitol operon activator-like protein [Saccharomonospora piscinae]